MSWETKRILVLVKTYPQPSKSYQEVVCTAGITDEGKLIGIYPIKYRYLEHGKQFEKFRWIEAKVKKNPSDARLESYKVDYDSIKLLTKIEPKNAEERFRWVLPCVSESMESIKESYSKNGTSLGILTPKQVVKFHINKSPNEEWTDEEWNLLNQTTFGKNEVTPLEKIPYEFSFQYTCDNIACNSHKMKVTDWEMYQAYRNFRKYENPTEELRKKYLNIINNEKSNTYFVVGTVHKHPGKFIIIGVFSINKSSELSYETSLFDL